MTKNEIEKIVHDYIMKNLTIHVEDDTDYYSDYSDKKVTIKLNGEVVDWDRD